MEEPKPTTARTPAPRGTAPRRVWSRPELAAYGSFKKLTQGRSGSGGESGNPSMMQKACL
ncbi:MAG: lasso RiPP family leader peptide-containing protein [Acidobacteriota bacterium]